MNKPINERSILIYGKSNIPQDLDVPENGDVDLLVKGNLRKVETVDNDDGTMDVVYKIKQLEIVQKME